MRTNDDPSATPPASGLSSGDASSPSQTAAGAAPPAPIPVTIVPAAGSAPAQPPSPPGTRGSGVTGLGALESPHNPDSNKGTSLPGTGTDAVSGHGGGLPPMPEASFEPHPVVEGDAAAGKGSAGSASGTGAP